MLKQAWASLRRHRIKPLVAWRAMRTLISDPDDTSQVFHIIEALKGDSLTRALKRLQASPSGRQLLQERPDIVPLLNDREWLQGLPEGSIGRAYYDFVHAENLSADGLIESSEQAPVYRDLNDEELWLANRLRDIHDLQHVMTGYGRDPVGELSLLSFMTTQTPNRGIRFIIWMARRRYRQVARNFDVDALIREGAAMGRQAQWMPAVAWETLLGDSLAAVRRELGFAAPASYQTLKDQAPERLVAA